ncbi:MAG: deoxyribonuclease V [Anaerolineae bacterium]|nr:deoxyribonuclease V [Anaerolineae bacterium]
MKVIAPHSWAVSIAEAKGIQLSLRNRLSTQADLGLVRTVAGVDVGAKGNSTRAAVVVLSYPELELLEQSVAELPATMPYVPGFLSFREAPAILAACEGLATEPDLFLFDGQGLAHPRRFGIASHVGVILDKPSIGCAKSRLCGTHHEPAAEAGSYVLLYDGDEVIGAVLRTRDAVRPVYVSIGHRLDLETAVAYVIGCCRGYRLPEPTRRAHRAASGERPRSGGVDTYLFDL